MELGQLTESHDVRLLGTASLIAKGDTFCQSRRTPEESLEDRHFKDIIGIDYRCYYLIEQMVDHPPPSPDESTKYERGVGYICSEDGHIVLKRELPLVWGDLPSDKKYYRPSQDPLQFCEDECYLRVSSLVPPTYIEALAAPHSVLSSTESFQPTPVGLDNNCLLGRMADVIQSIDMEELSAMDGFSAAVAVALMSSQKQLRLKARHLSLDRKNARLSASSLQALPVYNDKNKPPPQQGMIIYNADSDCLEYFDGDKWRSLVWREDDESTS